MWGTRDIQALLPTSASGAEENKNILTQPPVEVLLKEFADSAWIMSFRCWTEDPKRHIRVRSELNCAIVEKFRQNNIEIPFPQRDLHIRTNVVNQ